MCIRDRSRWPAARRSSPCVTAPCPRSSSMDARASSSRPPTRWSKRRATSTRSTRRSAAARSRSASAATPSSPPTKPPIGACWRTRPSRRRQAEPSGAAEASSLDESRVAEAADGAVGLSRLERRRGREHVDDAARRTCALFASGRGDSLDAMKLPYDDVHLIADPLCGYLRITLSRAGEIAEADVIDNPWVQRLKRIHQLQSSWWVFPTAEHSRFAHSLSLMHLAGELAKQVYPTLSAVEADTPSLPLVEETLRLAGLLHDLGHGPFSHFFDEEYLQPCFSLNHEIISQHLIVHALGGLIAELR